MRYREAILQNVVWLRYESELVASGEMDIGAEGAQSAPTDSRYPSEVLMIPANNAPLKIE